MHARAWRGDLGGRCTHGEDAGRPGRSDADRRARRRRQRPGGLAAPDEPVRRDSTGTPSRSPRWRALLRGAGRGGDAAVGLGLGDRPGRPEHRGGRGVRARAGPRARRPARRRRHGAAHLRRRRPVHPAAPDLARAGPGRRARARRPARSTGADWLHFCDAALAVRPGLPTRRACARWWTGWSASCRARCSRRTSPGTRDSRCCAAAQYADLVLAALRDYIEEPGNQVVAEAHVAWSPSCRTGRRLEVLAVATSAATTPGGCAARSSAWRTLHLAGRPEPRRTGGWSWSPSCAPTTAGPTTRTAGRASVRAAGTCSPASRCGRRPNRSCAGPCGPCPPGTPARPARRAGASPATSPTGSARPGTGPASRCWPGSSTRRSSTAAGARSLASAHVLMASPLRGDLGGPGGRDHATSATPPLRRGRRGAAGRPRGPPGRAARPALGRDARTLPRRARTGRAGARRRARRRGRGSADLLERPEPVGRRALYHAGMTGHPRLARLAADAAHPLQHRRAVVAAARPGASPPERPRRSLRWRHGTDAPAPASPRTPSTTAPRCPAIGFGTYPLKGEDGIAAITSALEVGYRLLDTAVNYENEREVGEAIRRSGLPRDELRVDQQAARAPPRVRRRRAQRARVAGAARSRPPRPAPHPLAQPVASAGTPTPGAPSSTCSARAWCARSASRTSPRRT